MAISRATFTARYPEFAEQSDSVVALALAEAERATPISVWSDNERRVDAVLHLTAHNLALRTMQIGAQIGTASGTPLGTGLNATLYGQARKYLEDMLPITGFAF